MPRASALAPQAVSGVRSLFNTDHNVVQMLWYLLNSWIVWNCWQTLPEIQQLLFGPTGENIFFKSCIKYELIPVQGEQSVIKFC
jgi:hypothetical protein